MNLSTPFHPQTNGQAERTIHTLDNVLRVCVIDFKGNWDEPLPLTQFAYNIVTSLASKWLLMKIFIGEYAYLLLDGLLLLKQGW